MSVTQPRGVYARTHALPTQVFCEEGATGRAPRPWASGCGLELEARRWSGPRAALPAA